MANFNFLVPKLSGGLAGNLASEKSSKSMEQNKFTEKGKNEPVQHNWCLPGSNTEPKPPIIFQHELLQNFSINMFCKVMELPFDP